MPPFAVSRLSSAGWRYMHVLRPIKRQQNRDPTEINGQLVICFVESVGVGCDGEAGSAGMHSAIR